MTTDCISTSIHEPSPCRTSDTGDESLPHHHYTEGNGPWMIWPWHQRTNHHDIPRSIEVDGSTLPLRSVDSDRIGWGKMRITRREILPLIGDQCKVTNIRIHYILQWNNASSGFPGWTIYFTADPITSNNPAQKNP